MYKITITRTVRTTEIVNQGHQWKPVVKNGDEIKYGYTPDDMVKRTSETVDVIYEQSFDELDIPGIIAVANKLHFDIGRE